ncbi:hypothetical protein F2Q68_00033705 [Brassica cretica]|uniref:Uncharacterized protein n=1 Tax=Brassica cretica TaxID=69181 RepID=A0A8S9H238_BRACR|nr:hypothetical protein F2Q68_00033705 [Brassica cretica]
MGVLVHEEPCGVQGPIRLEPAASRGGLIGFIGTWFQGRLGKCEDSSVLSHVGYKRDIRVDREMVEATSQLYQLEESDGTSSEVVQLS